MNWNVVIKELRNSSKEFRQKASTTSGQQAMFIMAIGLIFDHLTHALQAGLDNSEPDA